MTVQGETPTVADDDRQAAERQFTTIYQEHARQLTQFIYWHLPVDMTDLADDFAQDTFQDLWLHLVKGRSVDYPFALLKTIASRRLADHHKIKRNSIYDLGDLEAPEFSVVEAARGHQYAADSPELALLSNELDSAMERMRQASETWRKQHSQVAKMRKEDAIKAARKQRDAALVVLQDACRTVGELRAELERAGGSGWKSSTGWPVLPNTDGRKRKGHACSDLDMTHCVNGHHLDLENTGFYEHGGRYCRTCFSQATQRHRNKTAQLAGATS